MANPIVTAAEIQTALITGKFEKMTPADYEGFAGIEGVGYVWEVIGEVGTNEEIVVADLTETGMVVQIMDAYTGDYWNVNLATGEVG